MSDTLLDIKSPDLEKLERVFQDMDWKKQKTVVRAAFRKALKPTLAQAKTSVPKGRTRNLYNSLGLLFGNDFYKVALAARIRGQFKGYHAHLVESGTKDRQWTAKRTMRMFNRKTGNFYTLKMGDVQKTGRTKPTRFLWMSVRMTENNTSRILGDEFFKSLERYHKKNGLR